METLIAIACISAGGYQCYMFAKLLDSKEEKLMTKLTEEQKTNSLKWDADAVMEQIQMQESSHMRMSALVTYQLQYPDMTIRE